MIKNPIFLFVLCLCTSFWSCSSSMKSDAEKMADLMCESMQKTVGNLGGVFDGSMNLDDVEKHSKKLEKYQQKMMEKYDTMKERQEFSFMVQNKMMEKCL